MSRTRVKICGVRDPGTAEAAVEAGADAIGVVLVEGSPRQVDPDQARAIIRAVSPAVPVVAVLSIASRWRAFVEEEHWPGPIQVHGPLATGEGDEPDPSARRGARSIIRAIPFSADALAALDARGTCDAILVDGPAGGSGRHFDHAELAPLMRTIRTPIIVAGGLQCDMVGDVVSRLRPYGVDVSSGVESAPGVKDRGAMRAFCDAVRAVTNDRAATRES